MLLSRVGTDGAAGQVRDALAAAGVRAVLAADPDAPTCTVIVLVDGTGQRTMLADRGAAGRLSPADVAPAALAGARHLHVSGYVLLDGSSRRRRPGRAGRGPGGRADDVGRPAGGPAARTRRFLDLVRGVDLLLPSAGELAALGGAEVVLGAVGAVAVTAGAGGATWLDRTGRWSVPARPVRPVDTTGAGDAFDAGLLAAWVGGATPPAALRAGVDAGTRAVGHPGAWPF